MLRQSIQGLKNVIRTYCRNLQYEMRLNIAMLAYKSGSKSLGI